MLFAAGLTAACAGTPPQWWNPSGTYGNESASAMPAAGQTQPTARPVTAQETPVVQEENIASVMPDDSYEEMILTPMQDEETEEPAQGGSRFSKYNGYYSVRAGCFQHFAGTQRAAGVKTIIFNPKRNPPV